MDSFDLIVLGAGSAGFAAARVAAAQLRAHVALVDKGPLGGLCILAGCMPSKALIQSSNVAQIVRMAGEFGLRVEGMGIDFRAIMEKKERFVREFADFRKEGIESLPNTEVILGEAHFLDPHTIQVGERTLTAPKVILATGSIPLVPPVPGLAEAGFILSDQALSLPKCPDSLGIVGGGIIALELGQFYARMGAKVTLIEAGPRLIPREDPDVSSVITRCLIRENVSVHTGVKPFCVERDGDRKWLCFECDDANERIGVSEILVATGRVPCIGGLDLEKAGVRMEGRRMVLDRCLRTSHPDILAAGDVTGGSYLVHVAIADGELAARNALLGCSPSLAPEHLYVSAAFTEPNIARVGLSEGEAKQLGREVLVGRYSFADLGKAEILGETDGFVKMLADPRSGEILGLTIVGPQGAELIHEMSCAITFRATVEQFLLVPHVHPTLSEILTYPAEEILEQMRKRSRVQTTLFPSGYNDQEEACALENLEKKAFPAD
ncbi:MAG TPA: FAD-dependent oxidoreductase [Chroococcales cyanobacterium]|jgi:pyruvate/2-oxoglutarate dehydrogenase complex dihydrolipoamide dehydrogenase (E3) component